MTLKIKFLRLEEVRPPQIGEAGKNTDTRICPYLTLICHDRTVP
jgi:hypothetical protein